MRTGNAWDEHKRGLIFSGTVATDKLLGVMPFGKAWLAAVGIMATVDPTRDRSIKLRIYTDYEALRAYQTTSVTKLVQSFSQVA